MTYVIAAPCEDVMDASCTTVCPVDCISPADADKRGEVTHLFIDPQECIDCDACASACPVGAIFPIEQLPEEWASYADAAVAYFEENPA